MSTATRVSKNTQAQALDILAAWLGPRMGYVGPAPTGEAAAWSALGPMLNPEWDWPSAGPTPTILLEGGPEEWAVNASLDVAVVAKLRAIGIYGEPYSACALCLYPL